MRRNLASLAVLFCALTLTTACGGDEAGGTPSGSSPSGSASEESTGPKVIAVTIEGDQVTPNGERVEVDAGQDVELDVTADAPGEIHVHSTPEQELEYEKGETTLTITGLEQPGRVDVEVHDLEKILVQLEVS